MNKQAKKKRLPDSVLTGRKPFNGEQSDQTQSPIFIVEDRAVNRKLLTGKERQLEPKITVCWHRAEPSQLFSNLMNLLLSPRDEGRQI